MFRLRRLALSLLRPRDRRGSVMLLALGVLAILSVSAVAYVTIVRLDRAATLGTARRSSFQSQPDAVVRHMQSLLTADLFGNKIVTPDLPPEETDNSSDSPPSFWPVMFEDGETWDSPSIDVSTFTIAANPDPRTLVSSSPNDASILAFPGGVAAQDDAWLASIEPDWQPSIANTSWYRNITNLRSAYSWSPAEPRSSTDDRWVRGDGRFIDLGDWFDPPSGTYADPAINLLDYNNTDPDFGPREGNYFTATDPNDYEVFDLQINNLNPTPLGAVTPSDERRWVDTDGDLRPDARWQLLEQLGNVGGLNWVVAARIVDASALVNINTAVEFGFTERAEGRTPADVDLYRLLRESQITSAFPVAPAIDQLDTAYANHIERGVALPEIIVEAIERGSLNVADAVSSAWNPAAGLTRRQRDSFFFEFGRSPLKPRATRGAGYPVRDLTDLMAFAGTNNPSMVSRAEQFFDGPESGGYLPLPTDLTTTVGPLRAKEQSTEARRLAPAGGPVSDGRPTLEQIHDSTRRLLTPVSGTGSQSPVPVLNPYGFRGVYALDRVPIDRELTTDDVTRAFHSFTWALAPLATNMPMSRAFVGADGRRALPTDVNNETGVNITDDVAAMRNGGLVPNDPDFHYGGGDTGLAIKMFERFGTDPGATFALVTSVAMAVNLADAIDTDQSPKIRSLVKGPLNTIDVPADVVLTTRMPQGDVPNDVFGDLASTATKPITVVGLEVQPFLREVATFSFYREQFASATANGILGDALDERLGCVVSVELSNPFGVAVPLDNIAVVIPATADLIVDGAAQPLVLRFENGTPALDPRSTRVYAFITPRGLTGASPDWDVVYDEIVTRGGFGELEPVTNDVLTAGGEPMFIHNMAAAPAERPVLLVRLDGNNIAAVIDRMSPPGGTAFPPAISVGGGPAGIALVDTFGIDATDFSNLAPAGSTRELDRAYFVSLGYDIADERLDDLEYSGQAVFSGSLTRQTVQGTLGGTPSGFDASCIEFAPERPVGGTATTPATGSNVLTTRADVQAWLRFKLSIGLPDGGAATSRNNPEHMVTAPLLGDQLAYNLPVDQSDLLDTVKAANGGPNAIGPNELAPFQLFVPNQPLHDVSDVMRLSPFAHLCIDCLPDPLNVASVGTNDINNLRNWITVGEQLAIASAYDPNLASGSPPNPYMATLDPTRYIIGGDMNPGPWPITGMNGAVPANMRIPLALRVPDCFEALSGVDPLVQGRVNINTAPRDVLRMLPMLAPTATQVVGSLAVDDDGTGRVEKMLSYRDAERGPSDPATGILGTLVGLRAFDTAPTDDQRAAMPGFATPAETALIAQWNLPTTPEAGRPVTGQTGTFADLGADLGSSDISPLQVTRYAGLLGTTNPTDDAEEILASYRAISNIVSSRSDVFVAWFVLRGYDPETIERIALPSASPSDAEINAAMDAPGSNFRPASESRWLVVFDRSQTENGSPIRRPTDRPRILLRVELPSGAE
jgi:hypothetical protein